MSSCKHHAWLPTLWEPTHLHRHQVALDLHNSSLASKRRFINTDAKTRVLRQSIAIKTIQCKWERNFTHLRRMHHAFTHTLDVCRSKVHFMSRSPFATPDELHGWPQLHVISLNRDQKVIQINQGLTVSSCVLRLVPQWTLWCWWTPPLSQPGNTWSNKGNELDTKTHWTLQSLLEITLLSMGTKLKVYASLCYCYKQTHTHTFVINESQPLTYSTHPLELWARTHTHTQTRAKMTPFKQKYMLQKCKLDANICNHLTTPDPLLHQHTSYIARHLLRIIQLQTSLLLLMQTVSLMCKHASPALQGTEYLSQSWTQRTLNI